MSEREGKEIKCPKCGAAITVDGSVYAQILSQVRTEEFRAEVEDKLKQERERHQGEMKMLETKIKVQATQEIQKVKMASASEVAEIKTRGAEEIAKVRAESAQEVAKLKSQISRGETERKLAVTEAVAAIEKERDRLEGDLKIKESEAKLREQAMKERYEGALSLKDEEIGRLKDLKAKLSTKMVGETLEQHCEIEFNKLRATAFPRAYFEKDNAVSRSSGSKGDFIFRDYDENGEEIVSIMFEMKNENETTATKHKNEHFFKELDKDRREKGCEYAVLVTLLEAESELYNTGIVDVSYQFPKMYVIRPQFFIPMITLLRNAAMNSLKYKRALIEVKNQELDVTHFQEELGEWKSSWLMTMKNAGKKHLEAIEQINKAIRDLEKTRDALILSDKHLGSAENKLEDLTIKRLTKNNPTMREKFEKGGVTE